MLFNEIFLIKNETELSCEHSCRNSNSVVMLEEIGLMHVQIGFSKFTPKHRLRRNYSFAFAPLLFSGGNSFHLFVYDKIIQICPARSEDGG